MPFQLLLRATAVSSLLAFAAEINSVRQPAETLIAHEWGTFTSVAVRAGTQQPWAPLTGSPDLPCFVERLGLQNFKYFPGASVRMETPVIYFYSKVATTLSVHVGFPRGWVTEWYPKASSVWPTQDALSHAPLLEQGEISWKNVNVQPGVDPVFPNSIGASHYFAARNTDAAPLDISKQKEKLIFYRGLGNFLVPIRPRFNPEGNLEIVNAGPEEIQFLMVFENRGGKIGYRVIRNLKDSEVVPLPELTANASDVHKQIAQNLVEAGLYAKEALAMVETWKDSWFEEGTRVFYLAPQKLVSS